MLKNYIKWLNVFEVPLVFLMDLLFVKHFVLYATEIDLF